MNIGERLRQERERLGFAQADLGARAGVTRTSQFNYEAGGRFPDAQYLASVAAAGVDVLFVLTGSRSFEPPPALSSREAVLLDNYRRAGDTGRRTIESTAAAFAAGSGEPRAGTHQVIHGNVGQVAGRDVRTYRAKKPK